MSKAESLASCPDESRMHGAQVEEAARHGNGGRTRNGWKSAQKTCPKLGDSLSHICQTEGEANFASGSKSLQNEGLSLSQK